ncbi:MAG: ParB/RepB/Spo0J family partition protein, partial [Clostridia bacterium]
MPANKGLGRGYASLLGLNDVNIDEEIKKSENIDSQVFEHGMPTEIPTSSGVDGILDLELSEIDPNYEQPRKHFDQDALQELAESIRVHGVIQPIVVTPVGRRFMIIAGERRFRASKLAGKTTIPAIIRKYSSQQIKEISLIE